jgi:hypothetical protein
LDAVIIDRIYGVGGRIINTCAAVGGVEIERGNRSTQRKPSQVLLYPSQIPHDLAWYRDFPYFMNCVHKNPSVNPNLNHLYPAHTLTHIFEVHLDFIP